MSLAIWKFPFAIDDYIIVKMPVSARILTVQVQIDTPCIWALCSPGREAEYRYFRIAGTGHSVDPLEAVSYIGTFQLRGGRLVFHMFEISEALFQRYRPRRVDERDMLDEARRVA